MKALLILYVIGAGQGYQSNVPVIEQIPVSDIETCKVAGELISKDLEFKVREVSYRCVNVRPYGDVPVISGVN